MSENRVLRRAAIAAFILGAISWPSESMNTLREEVYLAD